MNGIEVRFLWDNELCRLWVPVQSIPMLKVNGEFIRVLDVESTAKLGGLKIGPVEEGAGE